MNVGIIYRIFYGDLSYVGSTIDLKKRMWNHISNYNDCSSKEIMCYDDYEVEILAEIYYVKNRNDINLRNLEREYMEQYKCVNKVRPIITEEERKKEIKEYRLENRDKMKEYQKEKYLENRDKILEQKKEKYLENRDTILEKQKQYHLENRDTILEKMKEYYLKNKAST